MAMNGNALSQRLVALFVLGLLAFGYPLLSLFSVPRLLFGVPLLYLYLFGAWLLVIVVAAWLLERGRDGRGSPG
jgi:hypothetical protein